MGYIGSNVISICNIYFSIGSIAHSLMRYTSIVHYIGRLGSGISASMLATHIVITSILALHSSTQIIIAPGYEYKIVKMLVTNFHQPQSTLLLLVSAFLKGDWKKVYDYALAHDFRFLSYGDSNLLIP